jgi:hypothetical protein
MSPIKRSLDDLPPNSGSSAQASGWGPDATPRWAHLLAEKWHAENMAAGVKPHAVEGTRFRHSDAGKCARAVAYSAAGIERSDPMDVTGSWNTRLGTMVHDAWQEALVEAFPDATVEVKVGGPEFADGDTSGHIDAVIVERRTTRPQPGTIMPERHVVAYELKTVGGYAFKAAIGKVRRGTPPEGPKNDHILQAALNGLAVDADEVVIGYLAKETLSKNYDDVDDLAKFCAEWSLNRAQYEPLARKELERIAGILSLLDGGELAARKVPGYPGEIEDPATSMWVKRTPQGMLTDTGSIWNGSYCTYCSYQALCVRTPSGRVPVDQVVELRGSM